MKKSKPGSLERYVSFLLLVGILLGLASCEKYDKTGPYVTRPHDKMLSFTTDEGVYLTSTDGSGATLVGNGGGTINVDFCPLASGSAYYLDGEGTLWYKSYLEQEYKVYEGVKSIFTSIGSVFALTNDGKLLRTDDSTGVEVVLEGISTEGAAPFLECGSTIYVAADSSLWRMTYGAAPERVKRLEGEITFLNGNGEEIYFAAEESVYKLAHKGISVKCISGKEAVTPVIPEDPAAYVPMVLWLTQEGTPVCYQVENGKTTSYEEYTITGEISARSLPKEASEATYYVLQGEELSMALKLSDLTATALPEGVDWVYADSDTLYGFNEEGLQIVRGEDNSAETCELPRLSLSTPDGYYYLTGSEEGYQATLWTLKDGTREIVSENVRGDVAPRAVYKYGGVSFVTEKGVSILDEETHEVEIFCESENLVDFIPKSGGAFALDADGNLSLMVYGESVSEKIASDVTGICSYTYDPERLVTYPIED